METQPSLDIVCQALHTLYHDTNSDNKQQANNWLQGLQKSVYAWQIADQLLQSEQEMELRWFAAHMMRSKILYNFQELPVTAYESLRNSLMEHIRKPQNDVILTQLCLALVDLAHQMTTWTSVVNDVIEKFDHNKETLPAVLEILTVIPEEINHRSLRLGANRRQEVTENLVRSGPVLLIFLERCLQNSSDDSWMQVKIYRCLKSWFDISALPCDDISRSQLLINAFRLLTNPDLENSLHEALTDCVCSAWFCVEGLRKEEIALAQTLYNGIVLLTDVYQMSVAMECLDKSINLCRIFTEAGETLLQSIVSTPGHEFGDLRTVELVLVCVSHYDFEVAEITFNFWYRLSEMLYKQNNSALNEMFRPYIQRLLEALCKHCHLNTDHEDIPPESDDFGDFRVQVLDVIKDVVFLIGSTNCFAQMFERLKSQTSTTTWDETEAVLFVMTAVARNVLPEENEFVAQVLCAILNLPENTHIAVRYTSIQLIGELCGWIQSHPDLLDSLLNYLLAGLQHPKLAAIAASSLLYICMLARDSMVKHFDGLVQIVQAMDSYNIKNDAAIDLLKATALVLSKMPLETIDEGFRKLCTNQVSHLKTLLDSEEVPNAGTKTDPSVWLDRLAISFRSVELPDLNGQIHPLQSVFQDLWPLLSSACTKYLSNVGIIERCCRCVRFAVRCIGKSSAPLLEALVTHIVSLYTIKQHSCFLYLGSILVDVYGKEASCVAGLMHMLAEFITPTFRLFEKEGFQQNPDTVDDFFRLCTRLIQHAPVAFLQSTVAKSVVQCAMMSCTLEHRDGNASLMKFLQECFYAGTKDNKSIDLGLRNACVKVLFLEFGPEFLKNTVLGCSQVLPTYMMPDIAEVVYAMLEIDRNLVCSWLADALKNVSTTGPGGSVRITQHQIDNFYESTRQSKELKEISHAFRDFNRLFR